MNIIRDQTRNFLAKGPSILAGASAPVQLLVDFLRELCRACRAPLFLGMPGVTSYCAFGNRSQGQILFWRCRQISPVYRQLRRRRVFKSKTSYSVSVQVESDAPNAGALYLYCCNVTREPNTCIFGTEFTNYKLNIYLSLNIL